MDYKKYQYYQEVQLWPLMSDFNYKRWLENFAEGEDRDIARHILDFFIYIPETHVDQMLKTVVGKCGYFFQQHVEGWSHDSFYNDCWYSFIPGDEGFVHSGIFFASILRDKLGIPHDRIIDPYKMVRMLVESNEPLNFILVDDFVGSGAQCCEAWNELWKYQFDGSISDIVAEKNHRMIYAPLVVNYIGKNAIEDNTKGLELVYLHLLGPEYNLFELNGLCWKGKKELYSKWISLHNRVVKAEKIPETGGYSDVDAKGFCEQGLALAFKNGIPDACPAFFYWESETWKPLIKRHYQHGCKR